MPASPSRVLRDSDLMRVTRAVPLLQRVLGPVRRSGSLPSADDTTRTELAGPSVHTEDEKKAREAIEKATRNIAERLTNKRTPSQADMLYLSRLLSYPFASLAYRQQSQIDALRVLIGRKFDIYTEASTFEIEMQVRVLFIAMRCLRKNRLTGLNVEFKANLFRQLARLREAAVYCDQNPSALYFLSRLRSAVAGTSDDESIGAAVFRFGIPIAQIAAGGAVQSGGAVASGMQQAFDMLRHAGMRPDGCERTLQSLEDLCEEGHGRKLLRQSPAHTCNIILMRADTLLKSELARLSRLSSRTLAKAKDAFNKCNVRLVDNEWDLAFGCLEAVHETVSLLTLLSEHEMVLRLLQKVIEHRRLPPASHRPLVYKCIEILRDLRRYEPTKDQCRALVNDAANLYADVHSHVSVKRKHEAEVCREIFNACLIEEVHGSQASSLAPRALRLSRNGSLRMMTTVESAPYFDVSRALPSPLPTRIRWSSPLPAMDPNEPAPPPYAIEAAPVQMAPASPQSALRERIMADDGAGVMALLRQGLNAPNDGQVPDALVLAAAHNAPNAFWALLSTESLQAGYRTSAAAEAARQQLRAQPSPEVYAVFSKYLNDRVTRRA